MVFFVYFVVCVSEMSIKIERKRPSETGMYSALGGKMCVRYIFSLAADVLMSDSFSLYIFFAALTLRSLDSKRVSVNSGRER